MDGPKGMASRGFKTGLHVLRETESDRDERVIVDERASQTCSG